MRPHALVLVMFAVTLAMAAGCAGEDDVLGGAGARKPVSTRPTESASLAPSAVATSTPTPTPTPEPTSTATPTPTDYATMEPPPDTDETEGPEASPPPEDQVDPIHDENTV